MTSPYPAVEGKIARLGLEGYEVEQHGTDQVILVRTNSWGTHWLGAPARWVS